jgi:hypothetical protein
MNIFSGFTWIVAAAAFLSFFQVEAQISGCTDPKSPAYHPSASINDGSCTYGNTTITPQRLGTLPDAVKETSGLMFYQNLLWTHNDSGAEAVLIALDPDTKSVVRTVRVNRATHIDWEDITRDESYLYIGDFGNNNGNRTDLKIYKVPLSSLDEPETSAETILFNYPDQEDFASRPNNHDYDAEALIAVGDSLYIFSKNWTNLRTKIYSIPKTPGTYAARLQDNMYVDGLITGADFNPIDSVVVLCGYNRLLQPFVWLLWDFKGLNFFSGNKRKISFNLPLHQMEGIAFKEKNEYWVSNETFTQLGNIPPAIFSFSTENWIHQVNTSNTTLLRDTWVVYPNPFRDTLHIKIPNATGQGAVIRLFDSSGRLLLSKHWLEDSTQISISTGHLELGNYILTLELNGLHFKEVLIHMH